MYQKLCEILFDKASEPATLVNAMKELDKKIKLEKKCENCRFWKKYKSQDENGTCHRYPPQIVYYKDSRYPEVSKSDYCGEFKKIID